MLRSLYTAGTGMIAQQQNLDVIANNLSNVNTNGFKQQRAEFQDLMYDTMRSATADGRPEAIQVGMGSRLSATSSNFTGGSQQNTGNPLNVMIQGNGFFRVLRSDGSAAYTRDGSFQVNKDGDLTTGDGLFLDPKVNIPLGTSAVSIDALGNVTGVVPGEDGTAKTLGNILVSTVTNPAGMTRLGGNLFSETEASGAASAQKPGDQGSGTLLSGFVESSNVEVVEEMTRMITAQRAYEINSKAIQTADDMLGIVNNLKR